MSPALARRFLTTGPRWKSDDNVFYLIRLLQERSEVIDVRYVTYINSVINIIRTYFLGAKSKFW